MILTRGLALVAAVLVVAATSGCEHDPDRSVVPAGSGWQCTLDVCRRECPATLPPGVACEPRATAFCMTYVDGASGEPKHYCASSPAYCDEIYRGQKKGVLGERPARRVSRCVETP